MKIDIYHDELYPYYGFHEGRSKKPPPGHHRIDIPEEEFKALEAAREAFFTYQERLERLRRLAGGR